MNIISIFYRIFHNKLFCYLVLSHKQLWYICLWKSRNRIGFFIQLLPVSAVDNTGICCPRYLSIFFTQARHPFLGSSLCTQHDEDWLRSCRISTHIQTHSLPPYVLVFPFSWSCDFYREFMIFLSWSSSNAFRKRHRVVQMKLGQLIQRYEASKHDWNESWWSYHEYRVLSLKCPYIWEHSQVI